MTNRIICIGLAALVIFYVSLYGEKQAETPPATVSPVARQSDPESFAQNEKTASKVVEKEATTPSQASEESTQIEREDQPETGTERAGVAGPEQAEAEKYISWSVADEAEGILTDIKRFTN